MLTAIGRNCRAHSFFVCVCVSRGLGTGIYLLECLLHSTAIVIGTTIVIYGQVEIVINFILDIGTDKVQREPKMYTKQE